MRRILIRIGVSVALWLLASWIEPPEFIHDEKFGDYYFYEGRSTLGIISGALYILFVISVVTNLKAAWRWLGTDKSKRRKSPKASTCPVCGAPLKKLSSNNIPAIGDVCATCYNLINTDSKAIATLDYAQLLVIKELEKRTDHFHKRATPDMLHGTIAVAREARLSALPAYQILVLDRIIEDKKAQKDDSKVAPHVAQTCAICGAPATTWKNSIKITAEKKLVCMQCHDWYNAAKLPLTAPFAVIQNHVIIGMEQHMAAVEAAATTGLVSTQRELFEQKLEELTNYPLENLEKDIAVRMQIIADSRGL